MEQRFKPVIEWQNRVLPPGQKTAHERVSVVLGEVKELTEAVLRETTANVMEEAADVMISTAGFMKAVDPNVDLDNIVGKKIEVMMKKYEAEKLIALQKKGLSFDQAMAQLKLDFQTAQAASNPADAIRKPDISTHSPEILKAGQAVDINRNITNLPSNPIESRQTQPVINQNVGGLPSNITDIRAKLNQEQQRAAMAA